MKYKILLFLTFIFIIGCTKDKTTVKPLLHYIPEDASVIIKINDLSGFKNGIKNNTILTEFKDAKVFRTIANVTSSLEYLNTESESILAFSELEDGNYGFTFVTNDSLVLIDLDSIQNKSVEEITEGKHTFQVYTINNETLYSAKIGHEVIFSSSKMALENLNNVSISSKAPATLKKLYAIASDLKPATVFINLENSNTILSSITKDLSKLKIAEFSDWVSLDSNIDQDQFNLNGITIANDSTKNYLNLFKNTNPLYNRTASFAPAKTDAILSYSFDDYKTFTENQQKYLDRSLPIDSLFNTVEEIGFIHLGTQNTIVLNTYGSETISEYLTSIKKNVIDYQGNEILELQKTNFLNTYFNPIINNYNAKYSTIIENAFLFSKNKETLQTIISNHKSRSTYNKTELYDRVMEKMAGESSILFISNSKGIEEVLKSDFSKDFYQDFKKASLSKNAFAGQIIADKDFFHANIAIQKIEKRSATKSVSKVFSVQLDAEIATDPQMVVNHNTRKKEIVVQDQSNILYLISSKGKILWKKQLKGPIQGKIEQVDIFKNGRLQLAFTTNNQFIVLDRNGKEVDELTKSYEGGNLNPIAVFDYEGKKDYRFVITQGDKIFMYNSKGNIVEGFKYTQAEKPIIDAPKHLKIRDKDYLVFKLEDGSLKILNRVGDIRTNIKEKIDFSQNQVYLYKNNFTLTDKKGVLYQIDGKGKTTKTNLKLSNDHGIDATSRTLAIMDDNVLSIRGKKVELELGVYTRPRIFYIYDKIYISVTDLQNQKIHLYDSQAKPIPNFPVFGTSLIDLNDLDNDRKLELVSKDQDNSLIVYKMN